MMLLEKATLIAGLLSSVLVQSGFATVLRLPLDSRTVGQYLEPNPIKKPEAEHYTEHRALTPPYRGIKSTADRWPAEESSSRGFWFH